VHVVSRQAGGTFFIKDYTVKKECHGWARKNPCIRGKNVLPQINTEKFPLSSLNPANQWQMF